MKLSFCMFPIISKCERLLSRNIPYRKMNLKTKLTKSRKIKNFAISIAQFNSQNINIAFDIRKISLT